MKNVRTKEFEGNGASCTPAKLPWYKKVTSVLFRFGTCPLCIIMNCAYSIRKRFQK